MKTSGRRPWCLATRWSRLRLTRGRFGDRTVKVIAALWALAMLCRHPEANPRPAVHQPPCRLEIRLAVRADHDISSSCVFLFRRGFRAWDQTNATARFRLPVRLQESAPTLFGWGPRSQHCTHLALNSRAPAIAAYGMYKIGWRAEHPCDRQNSSKLNHRQSAHIVPFVLFFIGSMGVPPHHVSGTPSPRGRFVSSPQ